MRPCRSQLESAIATSPLSFMSLPVPPSRPLTKSLGKRLKSAIPQTPSWSKSQSQRFPSESPSVSAWLAFDSAEQLSRASATPSSSASSGGPEQEKVGPEPEQSQPSSSSSPRQLPRPDVLLRGPEQRIEVGAVQTDRRQVCHEVRQQPDVGHVVHAVVERLPSAHLLVETAELVQGERVHEPVVCMQLRAADGPLSAGCTARQHRHVCFGGQRQGASRSEAP